MNISKVLAGFFFILAMTINFGFFYGSPEDLAQHSKYELFLAIVVNLIATVFKFGDKTQVGAVMLATSLVADIQLIASASIWAYALYGVGTMDKEATVAVISLSGGALLANIVSVILFIGDTLKSKR